MRPLDRLDALLIALAFALAVLVMAALDLLQNLPETTP